MKKLIYVLTVIVLASCDYEADIFEEMKGEPTFNFIYQGKIQESVNDSAKISTADLGTKTIDFNLELIDKSRYMDLQVQNVSGSGEMYIDANLVANQVSVPNGTIKCSYKPLDEGTHIIDLVLMDQYGKAQKRRLKLFVFNNLTPVAVCEVKTIGQNSPYEIEINAEDSFDLDANWGGHVVKYIYKIGNYYNYETDRFSSIKHICPGPGKYIVSLQVIDNDNGISQTVFKEISF